MEGKSSEAYEDGVGYNFWGFLFLFLFLFFLFFFFFLVLLSCIGRALVHWGCSNSCDIKGDEDIRIVVLYIYMG